MTTTPAEALQAIADARSAVEAAITAADPAAAQAALQSLHDAMLSFDAKNPAEAENAEAWQPVGDAMDEFVGWLEEPIEDQKAPLTRDQKLRVAVALARRGRGSRRNDPAEAIISTFEAGLVGLVKLTYHTLRLTVVGIAAVAHAAVHGAIHVAEHYRNGRLVRAHDRQPRQSDSATAKKSAPPPGAYALYR